MRRLLAIIALFAAVMGLTAGIAVADDTTQEGWATQANGGGMVIDTTSWTLDWGIPANASAFNLHLNWIPENANYLPPPLRGGWVGIPFDLRTWDFDSGNLVTTTKQMTLNFHYAKGDLMGLPESSLQIVQQVDIQWIALPATIDPVSKSIIAPITTSGTYGLLVGGGAHGGANTYFTNGTLANSPQGAPAPAPYVPAPAAAPAAPAAPAAAPAPPAGMASFIAGKLYFDNDTNGQMGLSDAPVPGATVKISSGNWSATTTTNGAGTYVFYDLQNGTYSVEVQVGPEWLFTSPQKVDGVSVNGTSTSIGLVNFGMKFK